MDALTPDDPDGKRGKGREVKGKTDVVRLTDWLRQAPEAEEGYRKALAVYRKVLGERHPEIAASYNNVAFNVKAQGKYADAEEHFRKALAVWREALGENHPLTADGHNNLAFHLWDQGKYAAAAEGFRKALALRRRALGEQHPATASIYNNVASNLNCKGDYDKAEEFWQSAAGSFARARLRLAAAGLDRAARTSYESPLPSLAAVLARNGKPEDAWWRFEEGLARGTWDDFSARLRRPAAERGKQITLAARLDRLDQLIERTFTAGETAELKQRREDLLGQRLRAQEELVAFGEHLQKSYGPVAGAVFPRDRIQAALPADTALVAWLDLDAPRTAHDPSGEHWGVVLRAAGDPVWVRLKGSGARETWTDADSRLPGDLRTALRSSRGNWQPLAQRLRRQRLHPLAPHLGTTGRLPAVRRLIVLPSAALAGVPVELVAEGYTVSYALSGTFHAHLRGQPKPETKGLLALADPVFDLPRNDGPPSSLPGGGVLLTVVPSGSNAAQSGLKPNDVLLRYNGADLTRPDDLKVLPEGADPGRRVPVTVWRDGRTSEGAVRPGRLGVMLAGDPAPKALAEQRRLDRRLSPAPRGGDWQPLPGTRVEVEALRRLFDDVTLLVDSQASEQSLHRLAEEEALRKYRYIHLATHGDIDDDFPMRSGVLLSRDALPDAGRQLDAGLPVFTGRLTVEGILRQWRLRSELVTLSACQTALGKYERGEGHVGFAQALILAGSRSVCLSLWKVDDAATALLMERFYQNLLSKREGLKGPLPKAEALAEAKAWLRTLPRQEALERTARLSKGVVRGKGRPVQPLAPPSPSPQEDKEAPPYAHPHYWAAFILIGDPE